MRALILILLSIQLAFASITLTQKNQLADNFTLLYLHDDSKSLTINNISTKEFTKSISNSFTFGHIDANTWFKISIENQTQYNSLVLYLNEPWFIDFTIYYETDKGFESKESGLFTPLHERDKEHIYPLFYLDIKPNETKTYYIQAYSKFSQMGSMKIATKKVFNSHKENHAFYLYGFYFGGLSIMFLLSMFLYLKVRERIFAYYAGYVFTTGVFIFVLSGICIYFGLAPWFFELQSSVPLSMIFLILFSIELLGVKQNQPLYYKILLGFIVLFFIFGLLILYELKPWLEIMNHLATLALLSLLFIALKIGFKGNANAKMYLPIMLVYVGSLAIMSSVFTGHLENNTFNRSAFIFVSYFELAFFSLILANKIHQIKSLEKESKLFKTLANKDALSGLYNRRYLTNNACKIFNDTKEKEKNLSILMIDIDKFKNINDTYGHKTGDNVIVEISKTLMTLVRENDIVVRYGGEEFVILLQHIPPKKTLAIAKKICKKIESLEIPTDNFDTIKVSVSIGVSEVQNPSDKNIEDILNRADKALYEAKNQGRNRVIHYSS